MDMEINCIRIGEKCPLPTAEIVEASAFPIIGKTCWMKFTKKNMAWYNMGKTIINHPPIITIGGMFTIPSHVWFMTLF